MRNKLLVICGPTATGKTNLAFFLGKIFDGEIVSADSRQVYTGLDIGTGKDIPKGFNKQNSKVKIGSRDVAYYTDGDMRIWGYDLVGPKEEFSVALYRETASKIIGNILMRNKLAIVTGGTGFYIKAVTEGIDTLTVPTNKQLREQLESEKIEDLYERLAQIDPIRAAGMNISDRKNPRRLIRAIEVGVIGIKQELQEMNKNYDTLLIGLYAPKNILENRIENRVEKRIKGGIEEEIINLLTRGVDWRDQSIQALGYRQWKEYFESANLNNKTYARSEEKQRNIVIEKWIQEEKRYAKRQMTWFKKQPGIVWFDTSHDGYKKSVEELVKKWYSNSNKITGVTSKRH
jgi:tRNA dimethylallyltransferase